jgi:CrcB protein
VRRAGWIALGGAAGALLRVGVAAALPGADGGWPWSTLGVNVAGSLGLGLLAGVLSRRPEREQVLRPLLAVGFFGALTTFSSLVLELTVLAADDRPAAAVGYTVLTVAGGLLAALAGLRLGAAR